MSESNLSSFYICHCGNTKDHHNFRHPFTKTTRVVKKTFPNKQEKYVFDASKFPVCTEVKCSHPQCSMPENLHQFLFTEDMNKDGQVTHTFSPMEIQYRNINFVLPIDAICNKCVQIWDMELKEPRTSQPERPMLTIDKHKEILGHFFTTKIVMKNLQDVDKVKVIDPEDDDLTIVYK